VRPAGEEIKVVPDCGAAMRPRASCMHAFCFRKLQDAGLMPALQEDEEETQAGSLHHKGNQGVSK